MEEITKEGKTWFEYDYNYEYHNYGTGGYPTAIKVKMAEEYLYEFDKRLASVEWSIDNLNDTIVTLKKSVTSITTDSINILRLNMCNYLNSSDMNLQMAFAEFFKQMANSYRLQPILHPNIVSVIDSTCGHKFQAHSDKISSVENTVSQVLGLLQTITNNYESKIQDLNSKLEDLELKLELLEN